MTEHPNENAIKEFEKLLNESQQYIQPCFTNGNPDGKGFENVVLKAMQQAAEGTSFAGKIEKTPPQAFPDIQVCTYLGVEVKQTASSTPRISGNSIFEQARVKDIEVVYALMCWDIKSSFKLRWARYEDCISDIIISHSPRYKIDLNPEGENFFSKIEIGYDTFRELSPEEQMDYVRKLYQTSDAKDRYLWWLGTREEKIVYRYFRDLEKIRKKEFVGECFFLCPGIFGGGSPRERYHGVGAYALGSGIINHSWRDTFSAGGKTSIDNKVYSKIVANAQDYLPEIYHAAESLSANTISNFWDCTLPPDADRLALWLERVAESYTGPPSNSRASDEDYATGDDVANLLRRK